jgi:hypothetical protein
VGNEKILVEDLTDYQEGRSENSDFQVGKEEEVTLSESLKKLEEASDHQGMLTEEEDQRHILIIGGIIIFLPSISVEAIAHVEGATEERQPAKTVTEEKE